MIHQETYCDKCKSKFQWWDLNNMRECDKSTFEQLKREALSMKLAQFTDQHQGAFWEPMWVCKDDEQMPFSVHYKVDDKMSLHICASCAFKQFMEK